MNQLYPLRFEPILRRYLWGGRRLGTVLGKSLADGNNYAESWEIVDHQEDQSVVAGGPLAGCPLQQLVTRYGVQLFGRHHPQEQFPLLFKFLDSQKRLSVQVHPNDEQARQLDPPDLGKTEAWVVLAAEPGSKIYAGLKPGVDCEQLRQHVEQGTCEQALHAFEPAVGDCLLILAGTVHALGEGLLTAEIQQASDTTFRLFDWNRVDADGHPRELHIEQSLQTIDFSRGPIAPQLPQPADRPGVEQLIRCDKFVLNRWKLDRPATMGGDRRFRLLAVIEGKLEVTGDHLDSPLQIGDTLLLPAECGATLLTPQGRAVFLEMYLP
ncbi:MAG: class I mannose-6-phosphate isomerase [Pirellulales bacterium]|nr:class I mannose-6-phosphate isomerase [Pirellulales bacterium]